MRIGIIDLGTNSVRFDVHQLGPGKRLRRLHREKIMVRLGQGIFVSGRLDRAAIKRTLHAFVRFKRIADRFHAHKILAFGTSALREAADRDTFLRLIQDRTGISVRVISGMEEANLISVGILSREKKKLPGRFGLVDIGGGSTEVSICRGKRVLHTHSFPLGTARLQQLFLRQSPPSPAQFAEMRRYIRNTFLDVTLTERWPKVDRVVGSSGTVRALGRILRKRKGGKAKKNDLIERERLGELVVRMSTMDTGELLGISEMEAKRVDMILGGAVLLEECMKALGAKKAVVTELSLRDGILEEEMRLYRQGSHSHLSLHMNALYEKAEQFGGDRRHLAHAVRLAGSLFDRLRSVHRLSPQWRIYLEAAMLLRDIGEAINPARQSEHTYYVVKNAELPAMEGWEVELVARLCLLHDRAKVDHKDLGFLKSKSRREAFTKLLALLKLADALDPAPESRLRIRSIRLGRKQIGISLGGGHRTGLEAQGVAKASPYFERVFRRSVSAE